MASKNLSGRSLDVFFEALIKEFQVTVYVDNMRANFGRMVMCHMIADTDDELHAMADLIGVARKWHQGDHYDIALSKRSIAIDAGAKEITLRECGCMSMRRRATGHLGLPCDAMEWARTRPKKTEGTHLC